MRFRVRAFVVMIGLAWLSVVTVLYSQQREPAGPEETSMPKKTIETVLKEETQKLMSLTGVVGTAQGECKGRPCITVFVVKKTPELLKKIPSEIEGYEVVIQATDDIRALELK